LDYARDYSSTFKRGTCPTIEAKDGQHVIQLAMHVATDSKCGSLSDIQVHHGTAMLAIPLEEKRTKDLECYCENCSEKREAVPASFCAGSLMHSSRQAPLPRSDEEVSLDSEGTDDAFLRAYILEVIHHLQNGLGRDLLVGLQVKFKAN